MTEVAEPDRVPCPFCKETIHPEALKCRWCGEFLKKPSSLQARRRSGLNLGEPDPTPVLVLGILGIVVCGVFGAFALSKGNDYLAKCRAMRIRPSGAAVAGRILGIISCVIMLIQAIVGGLLVMGAFAGR